MISKDGIKANGKFLVV